ncbi:sce7726 family protein, partial [Yersinia aleksiciae]|uniref:sce7726 family protein n=1 Tax=Yersinia aleksiciae TaxID=263819 RepID=UPI00119F954C
NEFRINNTIADVAIFNGTSTAYEIKTELDSFDRLDSQLSSYQKVFEHVYIVIPPTKLKLAECSIPSNIGIIILTEKGNIVSHKLAESNVSRLSKDWMFNCLRKSEYIRWYEKIKGRTLEGRVAEQKDECFRLFSSLDIECAHKEMVNILKERSLEIYEKEVFKTLPQSLLAALLNLRLNRKSLLNLKDNLRESIC